MQDVWIKIYKNFIPYIPPVQYLDPLLFVLKLYIMYLHIYCICYMYIYMFIVYFIKA